MPSLKNERFNVIHDKLSEKTSLHENRGSMLSEDRKTSPQHLHRREGDTHPRESSIDKTALLHLRMERDILTAKREIISTESTRMERAHRTLEVDRQRDISLQEHTV
ncbi:hypothetical protein CEXT_434471 [Caerostris extrusa]|uniref:Uncharacterized protein n=1 Tax=Caerostris extrusa TaxID=172846 RepID=A0AAV4MHP7_CAEEX|nr:hypothetical protein CEXT_434471 [Caerostris extrusa]